MKNILKTFLWMIVAGLVITSCTEDALDGLSGKYPVPEKYTFTSLVSQTEEKQETRRIFTIEIATSGVAGTNGQYNGNGEVLAIRFVGDSYYLSPASFTPAMETAAKKGNYIIGSGANPGSSFYIVSGSTSTQHLINSGTLSVTKSGDNYTITGNLWLDNGDVVNVSFAGAIVYEADIEPISLTKVLSASVTAQGDGTNLITLKLGTPGVTVVSGPYGDTYAGDGNYVSVDFISNDATLAVGKYTPADNGSGTDGNYIKGYDTVVDWGWGPMEFFNWGTCWFTLASDVESGVHIETGDIVVAKDGTTYTITGNFNGGDVQVEYVGTVVI